MPMADAIVQFLLFPKALLAAENVLGMPFLEYARQMFSEKCNCNANV